MFKKILIANRGEIAVRIIRACRDMGIISVAVYSTADKDAMHANLADESVCIGPAQPAASYLNMEAVITAAVISGSDAIHAGYGFLSENARFAQLCEEQGITFIGPSSESINLIGDKIKAKEIMKNAGVPVIPGSDGAANSLDQAKKIAVGIGYPVILKAANGGGGRGIRKVFSEEELESAYNLCRTEARASFCDDRLYIEKLLLKPRHIEIQVLADKYGNVVHLYERDCSLQRRHQKIIEEAPSVFVDDTMREELGKAAVAAVKAANYVNAGTIEFLADSEKNIYFMEMNTRIQVEHPVTEMITGIDLVMEQIRIAAGERLGFSQKDVTITGHAIECRINAEDADNNFSPSPGLIKELNVPGGPGVRVDSAVYQGYSVPVYYDSLISKLIVTGKDRDTAIARMRRALAEYLFEGITTNTDYLLELLSAPEFASGNIDINFIDEYNKNRRKT